MTENQVIIAVTHDGIFHSDELLSIALLKIAAHPSQVAVIRSRQPKDWERADYVIDVGGKNDGVKWFDHHMPQGAGVRENGIPFSSFGLLWNHLGTTAVRELLKQKLADHQITDKEVTEVLEDLNPFVCSVDAHDQALLTTASRFIKDRSVLVETLTFQQVISSFNLVPLLENGDESAINKQFHEALSFCETFLKRYIYRKASRVLSESFISKYDDGTDILVLPTYCDWNSPVSKRDHIKFIVYPSVNGKSYTVQAAKKGGGPGNSGNLRMMFPQSWAGLNEGELQKVSGVQTALFCHRDRFIAAASTLQGAITLAKKTINNHE